MIWIYTITFFLFELIGVTFLKSHTFYPDFRIGVPFKFAKENEVIWGMVQRDGTAGSVFLSAEQ